MGLDTKAGESITIKGLDAVNSQLKKLSGKEGRSAIRKGMKASLAPLKALVVDLLPQGETGRLKKAVKIKGAKGRRGQIRLTVGFGSKAWKGAKYYGSFRELGTKKMDGAHAFDAAFARLGEPTKADAEVKILAAILNVIESKVSIRE